MKRLLLFILLTFPLHSFASNYNWNGFPTPLEYCEANKGIHTGVYVEMKNNSTLAACWGRHTSGAILNFAMVARSGDSCPAETTYDPTTGECKSDNPCANKPPMPFSRSGTAPDGYIKLVTLPGGKPQYIKTTEGCFNGCLASTADQACKTKTSGPYFCQGTAYFDGQTCDSAGTPGIDSSSSPAYPSPEQTTDTKPCNYTTNSDGTQSCNSSSGTEKEGQICGVVSATGAKICVDRPPTKQGLDIATTVKTETDANGGKTTTKTDTATTTKCTDIKICTSTTTTVTTVVKPNGAVSGSCTGANCPDKNTNPDGDGDGFGDCATGDCGEGDGGGSPNTPELGDVDTYQVTTQKFYDKVKGSPIATSVNSISAPTGGTAPNFRTSSIAFLGGVSLDYGVIGQLWQSVADVLSLVMKAVWCFVAVVIFLMA